MSRFKQLYSLQDTITGLYGPPLVLQNAAEARRVMLSAIIHGQDTNLARHTRDYTLFHIGSFNIETGFIDAGKPECLLTGAQALELLRAERAAQEEGSPEPVVPPLPQCEEEDPE